MTTVGSLATVLWLLLLRNRGVEISSLECFRIRLATTLGMLLVAALTLCWAGG